MIQPEQPKGRLVLVVDDDDDIREVIELALTKEGYRVATARDGRECLARLRGSERPSLVLLDLMMPEMNGWAICRELAKDPELKAVPVVILTGDAQLRDDRLGYVPVVK